MAKLLPLGRALFRLELNAVSQPVALVQWQSCRHLPTFYNSLSADSLWKSVTTKSNAAKTSPRGKRTSTTKKRDLNKGQILGVGRNNMVWPGLNAPIIKGKELVRQKKLPDDPDREQKLVALRDQMGQFRRIKLSSLERGWSGSSWLGRSFGPPDPVEGQEIPAGLDSKVLELKRVFHMEGKYGRVGTLWSLVFVGNGEGIGGFAVGRGVDNQTAMKRARNRAAQKLMYIERYEEHTVLHDFYSEFGNTRVWVYKKPEGYGLVCHRAIKCMCELLGIKNMYAKVEGTMNYFNIVRAFMLGLLNQKPYQHLANETGLHVVERRSECYDFPRLLASPEKPKDLPAHEIPDFKLYVMNGVVRSERKLEDNRDHIPGWDRYLNKMQNVRNHAKTMLNLRIEYGNLWSPYSEDHPECKPEYFMNYKKKGNEET